MKLVTHGGAVPASAFFNLNGIQLVGGKGAGKFTREGEYQFRKEITTIVDVDDKNCLAELTVALKLNQGARQWLYIVAGALFFVTFFCASKRKYINFSFVSRISFFRL